MLLDVIGLKVASRFVVMLESIAESLHLALPGRRVAGSAHEHAVDSRLSLPNLPRERGRDEFPTTTNLFVQRSKLPEESRPRMQLILVCLLCIMLLSLAVEPPGVLCTWRVLMLRHCEMRWRMTLFVQRYLIPPEHHGCQRRLQGSQRKDWLAHIFSAHCQARCFRQAVDEKLDAFFI
jgi:hypothetical protein